MGITHSLLIGWHLLALATTSIALCRHTTIADEGWRMTQLLRPSTVVTQHGLTQQTVGIEQGRHFAQFDSMMLTVSDERTR
jgi:hypothetical protein